MLVLTTDGNLKTYRPCHDCVFQLYEARLAANLIGQHSALLALPYLILVSNANFPEENSADRFSAAARSILVAAITDF